MTRIHLQTMLENLPEGIPPSNWADLNVAVFSRHKHLWDYQQSALRNALLALWK
jgi:type III restriction enzyme